MKNTKPLWGTLSLGLFLLLASCGGNQPVSLSSISSAISSSETEVIFRQALGADIAFTDPHMADDRASVLMVMNTFEGLFRLNERTGKAELGIAESYNVSSDGKTYLFKIRPNVTFTDGVTISAQTFLDSFRRALDPSTNSSNAYMLAHVIENGDDVLKGDKTATELGVRVIDNLTLEVKLAMPAPYFLDILARPVAMPLPMHLVRENPDKWNRTFPIVSNGAFTMTEWQPSNRITLDKNPKYWDAQNVGVTKIITYTNDDLNTAYSQYVNGEIDLLWAISPDKVAEAKLRDDWHSDFYYNGEYYIFNVERKPFDDVRVRRALNLAVNRDTLTGTILNAGDAPLYAMIPSQPGYRALDYFSENVAQAKTLLAQAGFPDGQGFPEFTILYNTNENTKKVAEFVQEQWRQNLGIHANLQNMEWKTFLNTIDAFDYDVTRSSWMPDYPDPLGWLDFFHSKAIYSNYHNAQFDALLDETNTVADPATRMLDLQKVEEKLMRDLPFMPLYTQHKNVLIDETKWSGYYTNPTGLPFYRSVKRAQATV